MKSSAAPRRRARKSPQNKPREGSAATRAADGLGSNATEGAAGSSVHDGALPLRVAESAVDARPDEHFLPEVAGTSHSSVSAVAAQVGPSVIESRIFHGVAKCRWCGGRFRQIHGFQWLCENDQCAEKQISRAILKTNPTELGSPYFFLPLPLQCDMELSDTKRLLVHGSVGISKSVGGRNYIYQRAMRIEGYRGLLLRCTYDELWKNHLQFIPSELEKFADAKWTGGNRPNALFNHNGAQIYCGYCQHDADVFGHLGSEWDDILFEEAGNFVNRAIIEISARDRGAGSSREARARLGLPNTGRSRYLTNPGGKSMALLEDFFIRKSPDPKEYPHYVADFYGHISGDVRDNPYLAEDFAQATLGGLDADRYEQLAHGRWDVFPGQFFRDWIREKHIALRSVTGTPKVGVLNYGYNRYGVFHVAELHPNGRVYVLSEWKFRHLTIPKVASELRKNFSGLQSIVCPIDMSDDSQTDRLKTESPVVTFAKNGISLTPVDSEKHGWSRVHDYFRVAPDGDPWLQVHPSCVYLTRTLPTLIADPNNADDLDNGQDDRAALTLRTLIASRPQPGVIEKSRTPPAEFSLGWFKSLDRERRGNLSFDRRL